MFADAFLDSLIDLLPTEKYTLLYTTSPLSKTFVPSTPHSSSFTSPLHMEMKRANPIAAPFTASENSTLPAGAPLFERYQFLSPGLFMGLLVTFLLLSILGVGLKAISSLQVSYGAFEKENGPAAHKKQ